MRRRPGIAGLQSAAAARDQYRLVGENVAKIRADLMKEQLTTFRSHLEEFARKHKHRMGDLNDRYVYSSTLSTIVRDLLDDDDEYQDAILAILIEQGDLKLTQSLDKQLCRTRPFTGHQLIFDILNDHPDRGYDHFRMTTTTFSALRDELFRKGLLQNTCNMTIEEQLGIFLYCVGHGVANRVMAETFQHSGETISRHFNNVLRAIVTLKDDYITLPPNNVPVHARIRDNVNFHPFKNAIGAIDGTHLSVVVSLSKQPRFRNRKGFTSQNMMAAVSFDHNFQFVCTGWEGSAADMRVFRWACESGGFTVPEGKYYLVDSSYANSDRFLAPYRGERYHISQFEGQTRGRTHRSPRDLYNHRHAQLRNVVEKTFGILKKRFKILTVATPFSFKVQCQIAMACCVIHNFIRRHQSTDAIFNEVLEELATDLDVEEPVDFGGTTESRSGDVLRTIITDQLWANRS